MHPHLGEQCQDLGIKSITIDLLKPGFSVEIPFLNRELELSTDALRNKFRELLVVENILVSEIKSANATFDFFRGRWPTGCYIEVVTVGGKIADAAVDSSGRTAEVLRAGG